MFVDEAQDLSGNTMEASKKNRRTSTDSFIAGDDDQGIYKWNGAHVNTFINLKGLKRDIRTITQGTKKTF